MGSGDDVLICTPFRIAVYVVLLGLVFGFFAAVVLGWIHVPTPEEIGSR
jgi:lipopolysaccharide export LptBFGC system permease protein LptF